MIKLKKLLLEYNDKVSKYSLELGNYIKLLKPRINGWKFDEEYMSGSWYWEHPKFEDVIYATWGWEGQNKIPIETSSGESFKAINLKITPPKDTTDEKQLKKDAKKYIDKMKKELPKLQKKLLEY